MADTLRIEITAMGSDYAADVVADLVGGISKVVKSAETAVKKAAKAADREMVRFSKSVEESMWRSGRSISAFDKAVEKTQDRLDRLARGRYQVVLDVVDMVSPIIDNVKDGLIQLTGKKWEVDFSGVCGGCSGSGSGMGGSTGNGSAGSKEKDTDKDDYEAFHNFMSSAQTSLATLFGDYYDYVHLTMYGLAGIHSGIDNWKKAGRVHTDGAERSKQIRTGATKVGLVGGGTAAGAFIGSLIAPGIGTKLGAMIGGGLGGMLALESGDSISDWLGKVFNARDQQQEALKAMGEDLKTALDEYETSTSNTNYVEGLVNQYKDLENALKNGELNSDDLATAQERIRDISLELAAIFPGIISEYDILNGKVDERIGLVEQEIDAMDKRAKRDLKHTAYNYELKLPVALDEITTVKNEMDTLEDKYEKTRKYNEDIIEYNNKYNEIQENENMTDEEKSVLNNRMLEEVNSISYEHGYQFSGLDALEDIIKRGDINEKFNDMYIELQGLEEKYDERQQELNDYYAAKVALINAELSENGYSFDIRDMSSRTRDLSLMDNALSEFDNTGSFSDETINSVRAFLPEDMDIDALMAAGKQEEIRLAIEGTKGELENAIQKVKELNDSLAGLPVNGKINISFVASDNRMWTSTRPKESNYSEKNEFHANGGILSSPHLGLVAEDGPESIIPLSEKRRSRGIALWKETGRLLGVTQYADGGIAGILPNNQDNGILSISSNNSNDSEAKVNVDLQLAPTFEIHSQDGGDVTTTIKQQLYGMVDELAGDLADKLSVVFSNMPKAREA